MCTVSFIPTASGIHLTSNRDERPGRSRAFAPAVFTAAGSKLLLPKDPDAGGSWIALKDNGDAVVLMNGAAVKHDRKPPYRRSRGLVLLDVIADSEPLRHFTNIDLNGVEPFTMVLWVRGNLWECRWNGVLKHQILHDARKPHIWSAVTLYNDEEAEKRKEWFREWLNEKRDQVTTEDILYFHQHAGNGDIRFSLVMNRDNQVHTVSITSIYIGAGNMRMVYRDLQSGTDTEKKLVERDKETTAHKWLLAARRIMIRALHWEFWPSFLIYGPIYFYWLWLSIKARSFFFFSAANPGIRYAGFAQERKSDIYTIIPEQYYPPTQLHRSGTGLHALLKQLERKKMRFPLIAKPDIGERGVQVKLLHTMAALEAYHRLSEVDFIVQEYIDYELEAGIFYYRIPGERKGRISGIVGKEFLSVTGDGRSSIAKLLEQRDRTLLQLPALRKTPGIALETVLPAGQHQVIVPYGNHSRGALFRDLSDRINERLTEVIDKVCKQIPGFYYGRLDIRFSSWEELSEGKNFSIIELNGAGSEPTHIYDPGHSLFFAWKEICRHWKILYNISRLNAERQQLPLMKTREGMKMLHRHTRHLRQVKQL